VGRIGILAASGAVDQGSEPGGPTHSHLPIVLFFVLFYRKNVAKSRFSTNMFDMAKALNLHFS
jgi:hypothetical protein